MSSPFFLTLVLMGASCLYLYAVAWSFRASGKRDFSTPWLLLPLSGAAITGVTLIFNVPATPESPVLFRLLELLAHLCNIVLIWAIASKLAPANRLPGTLLYAWNPLVLIELAVYANTAGVVICLLLLAVATLLMGVPSPKLLLFRERRELSREKQTERPEGDRKGPHSTPPHPRLYYDNGSSSPDPFIVEAGVDEGKGGDPCGRLRTPLVSERKSVDVSPSITITDTQTRWDTHKGRHFWIDVVVLVLAGLAVRINFMTLLIAPLLLWFMVRHRRGVSAALMGFTWRALVVLAIFVVAYLPGWQGSATFLAITNALHLFDFANSPLSLIVMPVSRFFGFVAQRGHFPSLMQPTAAAEMTVLATSFFLFALLYLREMGKVRARLVGAAAHEGTRAAQAPPPVLSTSPAPTESFITGSGRGGWLGCLRCPGLSAIPLGLDGPRGDIAQRDEDKGMEHETPEESLSNEDKHKAPSSKTPASTRPRPLSLQDGRGDADEWLPCDALFTGWTVVILGYIVLAATVFSPGYIVWGVWVVALRRFDTLSVCVLLLSCSALLYYPAQQFASSATGVLLPVFIFGIPLVYLVVQRCIPAGRVERKNVLT